MIREHDFNSRWFGRRVGIVTDPSFFGLSPERRDELLRPYAWAEFKAPFASGPEATLPSGCGFVLVDVQVEFRIALKRLPVTESQRTLEARFLDVEPLVQSEHMRSFAHERFAVLPGVDADSLNRRYKLWAEHLVETQPQWCVQVSRDAALQGWFFAQSTDRGLNLTLAALHRDAVISGATLYACALQAFGERGAATGYASFSVGNTDVHNIYAWLGARFVKPAACWIFHPDLRSAV